MHPDFVHGEGVPSRHVNVHCYGTGVGRKDRPVEGFRSWSRG